MQRRSRKFQECVPRSLIFARRTKRVRRNLFGRAILTAARQSRLEIVGDGRRAVLEDFQCILDNYNSLSTKTKRTGARPG